MPLPMYMNMVKSSSFPDSVRMTKPKKRPMHMIKFWEMDTRMNGANARLKYRRCSWPRRKEEGEGCRTADLRKRHLVHLHIHVVPYCSAYGLRLQSYVDLLVGTGFRLTQQQKCNSVLAGP